MSGEMTEGGKKWLLDKYSELLLSEFNPLLEAIRSAEVTVGQEAVAEIRSETDKLMAKMIEECRAQLGGPW